MGTKYSSQSASGYNASPPSDDGTASESNKVKWSTIKTKLSDVVKTLAEGINTALVTALDHSARSVTDSDSAAASDNERVIEVKSASVQITLADAATMAAGYMVTVANQSSGNCTVRLATATDTIDMVTNTTVTIGAKEALRYIVNAAQNGYITVGAGRIFLGTEQASTSGTNIDFTIPAGVKRVLVNFAGVSTNAGSNFTVQIGDSGTPSATGYLGTSFSVINAGTPAVNAFTVGFGINTGSAATVLHGTMFLNLLSASANTWVASGTFARTDTALGITSAGSKSLSGLLNIVRITAGGDTFDAGAINVQWEF